MKQLVILSGKGGTGKTTVASALIKLARHKAFADCDVDAPNLHLVYSYSETTEERPFYGLQKAVKDDDLCLNCGKCEELCRFGAIKNGKVNEFQCEGCGVCEAFCPAGNQAGQAAIRLEDNIAGETYLAKIEDEFFAGAQLKMGNGASGKLVTEVRKKLISKLTEEELVIIDGSPGIGCPVIASVTGTDLALLVAEPTLSGIHDLHRIVETVRHFRVECLVCVNKFDVNIDNTQKIKRYCKNEQIPFVGCIPFDVMVVKAVNTGKTIVDFPESPAAQAIKEIWQEIRAITGAKN